MTGLVLSEDQSYGGLRDDLGLFSHSVSPALAISFLKIGV